MAALATLATTTLDDAVGLSDGTFKLASTSGLIPGVRLYVDRELATVIRVNDTTRVVDVQRGVDGTWSTRHSYGSTVIIGRADQFYSTNPAGLPPTEPLVSPYINVVNGTIWTPTGDEAGPGLGARFWTQQVSTQTAGALGVRVNTTTSLAPL